MVDPMPVDAEEAEKATQDYIREKLKESYDLNCNPNFEKLPSAEK